MYFAPSVSYPTGRCAFWAACWTVPWVLGCVACIAWVGALGAAQMPGWTELGLLWPVLSAGLAWRGWRQQQPGRLHWSGQVWAWQDTAGGAAQTVQLGTRHLLGRRHLLLELEAAPGRRWVCACAHHAPADWAGLCRAVYSRADAALPGGTSS